MEMGQERRETLGWEGLGMQAEAGKCPGHHHVWKIPLQGLAVFIGELG